MTIFTISNGHIIYIIYYIHIIYYFILINTINNEYEEIDEVCVILTNISLPDDYIQNDKS